MKNIIKAIESALSELKTPLLLTLVEVAILATCAWLIATYVPHSIDIIKTLGWVTWVVIVSLYKIVTYKYNDTDDRPKFDNQTENNNQQPERIQVPIFDNQTLPEEPPPKPSPFNVKSAIYPQVEGEESDDGTSTRE